LTDLHLASDSDVSDSQTGLFLLKYVRTVWPNVSCVLMTAWGEQDSLSKAVRLGVDRILIKPLKRDELLSVLHRLDQARKTREALHRATQELESRRQSIEKLRNRERQFALLIQESLLFHVQPHPLPGIVLSHEIRSLYEVSGDVLDVSVRVEGCIDILLGDVMGKDMAAALLSAGMKSVLATTPDKSVKGLMNAVLARMNPMLRSVDSFVTCVFLRVDTRAGTLEMVDLGAPPLLIQRSGLERTVIQAGGYMMPLGIENRPVETIRIPLYSGDRILLMCDGIIDGMAQADSRDAVHQIGCALVDTPAGQEPALCARLMEISEDANGHPDDRICMVLRYDPTSEPHPRKWTAPFAEDLTQMSAMRDWLQHILSPMPWATAEWMDGALLGCTELFSNIVKHTQTAEPSNSHITLLVNQSDQACTFEWHFKKRPFNFDPDKPTQLPEPESLQESGYGMYLVDQLFEQLHYFTHCPEHQSIIAIKLLPAH
jgi:serine phosphatase RsbU (regulator of sigma subunit)/anti-sigma regulatory factor (Ser/Thr protein kinase)